jgi:TolB-like protein
MNYHFDNCDLSIKKRELRRGDVVVPVEPQVFELLQLLIENRERVVSRDEIFQIVWRGRIVSEAVLATRINAARTAIGDNGKDQRLIRTYRRRGLRFVGTVKEERAGPVPGTRLRISAGPRLADSLQDAPVVAVLPFAVSGPHATFSEGLDEEIVTALSRLGWLHVISNRSMVASDASGASVERLACKLGARYLLRGRIRHTDDGARITVHLVDWLSGYHIWSERYDCGAGNVFGIQDDVVAKVVTALCAELYNAEARRAKLKSPESLVAWECVVRALSLLNTRKKPAAGAACSLLQRAISIDPKCAPAHALLSFAITLSIHLAWASRSSAEPAALHAAQTAINLDQDEPWAHLALGYVKIYGSNRPEEAIQILNHALSLNSSLAMAHYLIALSFSYIGLPEQTFPHADLADALGPYDLLMRGNAGASDNVRATACWVAGHYREGIEYARRVLEQSPRQVPAYRALIVNSSLAGEVGRSTAILRTIKQLAPALPRYISDVETMYSHRVNYMKFVEGFRMAGFRLS